jgi:hypothetical protein
MDHTGPKAKLAGWDEVVSSELADCGETVIVLRIR